MRNKKVVLISLLALLFSIAILTFIISGRTDKTFDEYSEAEQEYDISNMDTMFNEDLIPEYEKNVVEVYLIANKSDLISQGVPEEFFDTIEITMHNSSVYTIIAGDKVLAIGLTEEGEVEYCNVF